MLDGVRVLSICQYLAGPIGTRILSDLGADVIKIENVDKGDQYRYMKHDYDDELPPDLSHRFIQYNRGKRSLPLDLKRDEGVEVFGELAETADVIFENLRPNQLSRFGIGYEDVKRYNPDIVFCSISGFGETGPYSHRGALDTLIQAQSGLASQNAARAGQPVLSGIYLSDMIGGLYGVISVLAALASEDTEGTYIDLAMLDGLVSLLGHEAAEYTARGTAPPRVRSSSTPQGIFRTQDGFLAMHIQDRSWTRLCEILGLDDWADSGDYDDRVDRARDEERINGRIEEALQAHSSDHWLAEFLDEDMLVAPVNTVDDIFTDAHVEHRDSIREVPDPVTGTRIEPDYPARFDNYETPETTAPRFGEHVDEILDELGYAPDAVETLYDTRVVSDVGRSY